MLSERIRFRRTGAADACSSARIVLFTPVAPRSQIRFPIPLLARRLRTSAFIFMALTVFAGRSFSQSDTSTIYDLDLAQLARLKITLASKTSESINELPTTIRILTASDLRDQGCFSLEDALGGLPGFQFRNILGINSYAFQRGIPNQNNLTLVLIDGVQVNELNSGGFYAGSQYNLANVERIEVLYGPASVVYGTNAVSGVINIVTRDIAHRRLDADLLAGSFAAGRIGFSYSCTDQTGTGGIAVSGALTRTEKADLRGFAGDNNWTDVMDNFERDRSMDVKAKAGGFVAGINVLQKQSSTATLTKSAGTIFQDHGTLWNIMFANGYLKFNRMLSAALSLSSILYYRNTTVLDNSVYYIVDTAQIGYYRPNDLAGIEAVTTYKSGSGWSITGGITAEYQRLAEAASFSYSGSPAVKPPAPRAPAMTHDRLVSLFLEPTVIPFQHLFLSAGIRSDFSSVYHNVVTPRAGVSYHAGEHIFRCSYAEAFRSPKPWDYTDGLGNSSLLPERMKSFECAATLSFAHAFTLDIIGYRNVLGHAIVKEIGTTGYRWTNAGELRTNGMEWNVRYQTAAVKAYCNYTYTDSRDAQGLPTAEISTHCANAGVTCALDPSIRLGVFLNYAGKRDNPKRIAATGGRTIEPYVTLHGTLSLLSYKGFDAQFIVRNIFDAKYFHPSNRDPDRYRQPQRTLMLTVGYHLEE